MAEEDDEIDMDPTEFLAHDDNDSDRGFNDNGPPILTSLGLTHRTHVNPFSFLVCFLTFGFLFYHFTAILYVISHSEWVFIIYSSSFNF